MKSWSYKAIGRSEKIISLLFLGALFFSGLFLAVSTQNRKIVEAVAPIDETESFYKERFEQKIFQMPDLIAQVAVVYDVSKDRLIFAQNADKIMPLASLNKVMTALVARETLKEDDQITISENVFPLNYSIQKNYLYEKWNLGDIIDLMLLQSSNECAEAISHAAGVLLNKQKGTNLEPRQAFVSRMNEKAKEMRLEDTSFHNESGLDESQTLSGGYGTAIDLTRLFSYLLEKEPDLLENTSRSQLGISSASGRVEVLSNTNKLIYEIAGLQFSKTGYTALAGGNLTILFDAGPGKPIVISVLGSTREGRFQDVLALVEATHEYFSFHD